mmetsp:Transcript_51737/g.85698  ORF Transcript_51737/g.85698 Transcript_51737/m.85698 type:complete len:470 (+) Transcript_51737:52-1461(+)
MLRAKQRKVGHRSVNTISSKRHTKPVNDDDTDDSKKSRLINHEIIIVCIICVVVIAVVWFWSTILPLYLSYRDTVNTPADLPPNLSNANKALGLQSNQRDTLEAYQPGVHTIYVSIATLGDHACPLTINNVFTKAKYPHNIYVGIYQQNEGDDPDCLAMLSECGKTETHATLGDISTLCAMRDHIAINRTTIHDGAKGPVYGRYMSMKLLGDKKTDFICMIDSHTLFRQDWDEFTMQTWFGVEPNHEKAVLTHYPWGAHELEKRIKEKNPHSYHICGSVYEGAPNYMVRNANGCFAKNAVKPVRVPFFAGGFSFASTQFWSDVPLDPYLLYIFNGEEFDIATRGFTHGYDFYSPPVDIVGHYYDKGPKRRSPHVGSNAESHSLRDKSEKRLNYLWGLWETRYPAMKSLSKAEIAKVAELRDLDKYGLGKKRTLEQFWKFAGIDPYNKNITVFKEDFYAKGGLEYVPYNN